MCFLIGGRVDFQHPPRIIVRLMVVADEHARAASFELVHGVSCILERMPSRLHKQPLMRIRQLRFTGRQSEEPMVEAVDSAQIALPDELPVRSLHPFEPGILVRF